MLGEEKSSIAGVLTNPVGPAGVLLTEELQKTAAPLRKTILLVEDERFVRVAAAAVLKAAGYEVLVAKDALEATQLHSKRERTADLLVADVVLPGENGRKFARRLWREHPTLRVLLISGYPEQMRSENEWQCLAKPFSTGTLLAKVEQTLACDSTRGCESEPSVGRASKDRAQ
jgi:DNA-binding response OmpR family regulator